MNRSRRHRTLIAGVITALLVLTAVDAVKSRSACTFEDLGTLGGLDCVANAINKNAQVVGYSSVSNGGRTHAFLWQEGQMIDLGTLGAIDSQAWGVNNLGQVVGNISIGPGVQHAFLWENGVMTDLGTLPGDLSSVVSVK